MAVAQLALWLTATLGHFALTARWARRLLASQSPTPDETIFVAVAGGIGSLSLILHAVAVTTGLSLWSGLAGLLVWHGAVFATFLLSPKTVPPAASPRLSGLEFGALAMFAGIVLAWGDFASDSLDIGGLDAAHYHVPYAVNFALGVGPFDLPATPHLYPMGGSLLAAWFIVPLGDGLLIDLVMSLWFVLLAASMNYLFRLLTGHSGLAWMSWLVIAMFSTPLFRATSLMSADLVFAASFVALFAALTAIWRASRWRVVDAVVAGLSCGLLLGSKASGPPAAALLVVFYATVEAGRRLVQRRALLARGEIAWIVLAGIGTLGAGGVWIVRNAVLFGWFTEPWQPTTYLSVLGDLEVRRRYSVWRRARYFAREWIGPFVVIPVWLAGALLADLAAAARSRRAPVLVSTRAFAVAAAAVTGAVLIALLIRSPWTSLEWTHGLALRYILPFFALLLTLGAAGASPLSWREPVPPWLSNVLAAAIAVVGTGCLLLSQRPEAAHFHDIPRLTAVSLLLGGVLAAIFTYAVRHQAPSSWIVVSGVVVLLAGAAAPVIAARDARERQAAESAEEQEARRFQTDPEAVTPARRIYYLVRGDEQQRVRSCDRRRFFMLTRFDEPLTLQSTVYRTTVFYAARDVQLASSVEPMSACDYIVSNPAVMATDKGQALVKALARGQPIREVGSAGSFVVLGR